jgi:hypothetical protein
LPSQLKRKFRATLNTVGVLNGRSDPSAPRSRALTLAPFVLVSWHEPQLSVLSCDRRGSWNSCSPSATRRGSSPAGAGIGVIDSAPDNDRTVGAAAVNAPASTAIANKDAFRPGYGGQETIVRAHQGILVTHGNRLFRRSARGEWVVQIRAIRGTAQSGGETGAYAEVAENARRCSDRLFGDWISDRSRLARHAAVMRYPSAPSAEGARDDEAGGLPRSAAASPRTDGVCAIDDRIISVPSHGSGSELERGHGSLPRAEIEPRVRHLHRHWGFRLRLPWPL